MRLIVDGMNVIGSRPTGWWRDRRGAMLDFVDELAGYARDSGDDVTVVLDSRPFDIPEESARSVDVRFASKKGSDAADDVIVDIVGADEHPETLHVATSDKRLASRVTMLGAQTMSSGTLRRRLDGAPGRP